MSKAFKKYILYTCRIAGCGCRQEESIKTIDSFYRLNKNLLWFPDLAGSSGGLPPLVAANCKLSLCSQSVTIPSVISVCLLTCQREWLHEIHNKLQKLNSAMTVQHSFAVLYCLRGFIQAVIDSTSLHGKYALLHLLWCIHTARHKLFSKKWISEFKCNTQILNSHIWKIKPLAQQSSFFNL